MENATEEEIIEAAKKAHAYNFIFNPTDERQSFEIIENP